MTPFFYETFVDGESIPGNPSIYRKFLTAEVDFMIFYEFLKIVALANLQKKNEQIVSDVKDEKMISTRFIRLY